MKFKVLLSVLLLSALATAQQVITITPGPTTQSITINVPAVQVAQIPPPTTVPATQPTTVPATQPTPPPPPPTPSGLMAVADYYTVPFQVPTGPLNVGVVAWHRFGVAAVGFSVDGSVERLVLNPALDTQANVTGYYVSVPTTTKSVVATVYSVDGGFTRLAPLLLNQPARLKVYRNLTLSQQPMTDQDCMNWFSAGNAVWFDHCILKAGGRTDDQHWAKGYNKQDGNGWIQHSYFTDCDISNCYDGQRGASLLRNVKIHAIGSNFFTGTQTAINVECWDMVQAYPAVHGDIWQGYGEVPKVTILFGIIGNRDRLPNTRGINFWDSPNSNMAVVDCDIDTSGGYGTPIEIGNASNVVVLNSKFKGSSKINGSSFSNVLIQNVTATWNVNPATVQGVTVR